MVLTAILSCYRPLPSSGGGSREAVLTLERSVKSRCRLTLKRCEACKVAHLRYGRRKACRDSTCVVSRSSSSTSDHPPHAARGGSRPR